MTEDSQPPERKEYDGFILLRKDVSARSQSEAESLMLSRSADIKNDSILKDFEIEGQTVEEK